MILDTNARSALFAGGFGSREHPRRRTGPSSSGHRDRGVSLRLARSRHRARLARLLDLLISQSFVLPIEEKTASHYAVVDEIHVGKRAAFGNVRVRRVGSDA